MVIALCLTLGLAPYLPEPHIWGKLRWVAGGAHGMGPMDWFDLVFHGLPWLLLCQQRHEMEPSFIAQRSKKTGQVAHLSHTRCL